MTSVEDKINQITKFVERLYKPYKTKVVHVVLKDRKVYTIGFYFEEIPNKYLTNTSTKDPKKLKEHNLTLDIRNYIENYLGIKTSGIQRNNLWPEDHGITIVTQSDK